jgi:hypothetical protein
VKVEKAVVCLQAFDHNKWGCLLLPELTLPNDSFHACLMSTTLPVHSRTLHSSALYAMMLVECTAQQHPHAAPSAKCRDTGVIQPLLRALQMAEDAPTTACAAATTLTRLASLSDACARDMLDSGAANCLLDAAGKLAAGSHFLSGDTDYTTVHGAPPQSPASASVSHNARLAGQHVQQLAMRTPAHTPGPPNLVHHSMHSSRSRQGDLAELSQLSAAMYSLLAQLRGHLARGETSLSGLVPYRGRTPLASSQLPRQAAAMPPEPSPLPPLSPAAAVLPERYMLSSGARADSPWYSTPAVSHAGVKASLLPVSDRVRTQSNGISAEALAGLASPPWHDSHRSQEPQSALDHLSAEQPRLAGSRTTYLEPGSAGVDSGGIIRPQQGLEPSQQMVNAVSVGSFDQTPGRRLLGGSISRRDDGSIMFESKWVA